MPSSSMQFESNSRQVESLIRKMIKWRIKYATTSDAVANRSSGSGGVKKEITWVNQCIGSNLVQMRFLD